MRVIDTIEKRPVDVAQVYLTISGARDLRDRLDGLLQDPEVRNHFHIMDRDGYHDLSCSIVTRQKIDAGGYSPLELSVLAKMDGVA